MLVLVVASSRLRKYTQVYVCLFRSGIFHYIDSHFTVEKKRKREEKSWATNKRKYQFVRRIAQVFLSHSVWIKMNVQRGERTNDKQLSARSLAFSLSLFDALSKRFRIPTFFCGHEIFFSTELTLSCRSLLIDRAICTNFQWECRNLAVSIYVELSLQKQIKYLEQKQGPYSQGWVLWLHILFSKNLRIWTTCNTDQYYLLVSYCLKSQTILSVWIFQQNYRNFYKVNEIFKDLLS